MIDWIDIIEISDYEEYEDFAVLVWFEDSLLTDVRNSFEIVDDDEVMYFVPLPAILDSHSKKILINKPLALIT